MIKVAVLRSKTKEELILMLNGLLRERFKYNINKASGDFTKNHLFLLINKDIAKVYTVINEKKEGAL